MDTVKHDAEEFGLHLKQGGWRLGLLVARNVEKGKGDGVRRDSAAFATAKAGKVSAAEFGRMSHTTADRVLRHLEAWEKAAENGHVPHAATITPGDDLKLDAESLPPWSDYYRAVGGGRPRDSKPEDAITIIERQDADARAHIATQLLADPDTRAVMANDPEGLAAAEAIQRTALTQRDPAVADDDPLPPPPAFAAMFWRAVTAVQNANAELERLGVRGLDARPETRAAAERMAVQSNDIRNAVVDFVVDHITEG